MWEVNTYARWRLVMRLYSISSLMRRIKQQPNMVTARRAEEVAESNHHLVPLSPSSSHFNNIVVPQIIGIFKRTYLDFKL